MKFYFEINEEVSQTITSRKKKISVQNMDKRDEIQQCIMLTV